MADPKNTTPPPPPPPADDNKSDIYQRIHASIKATLEKDARESVPALTLTPAPRNSWKWE